MRFYVIDDQDHHLYITFPRPIENREDIPYYFEIYCQHCDMNINFSRNDVIVEADTNFTAGGAVAGGLIGILGGPIGVILGGAIGGILGANADSEEQRRLRQFD